MAVAELDGKIYLIGGYPSSPAETQSVVAVYEIATDDWSFAAELPIGLHHPVAVGVAGKIYSLGGQLASGETDRTLEYDPEADSWRDLEPMPTARGGGAAAVIGDKIYVAGGRPPAGNAFEVYDIGDDAWESLPDLPQTFPERNHLIAAALGDKIYVAGGRYDGGGFTSPRTRSLDVFDPSTGEWSLAAEMLRERGGLNGVAANGCFFVWGGEGSNIGEPNDVYPDHDVYDPVTDTWTALPDLPTPVHGVTGSAFVDGLIYIPGGGTRSGGGSGTTLFQVYRVDRTCL
jgi:N-acetylneuraminic acid mutarotase